MAEAIREYEGGVVIISHNAQFVDQVSLGLCALLGFGL
jgi:ATPase subunit of ABC transporter with duplicated ATPase domains